MGRYILKRLLWMIPIILGVTVLVFTMMTICPGDPATTILGSLATEEALAAKRVELGLDQPYFKRLVQYLIDVYIRFDLGASWISKIPIISEIKVRLPRTMILSLFTTMLSFGIGIPLGISAATKQGRWQDHLTMVVAMVEGRNAFGSGITYTPRMPLSCISRIWARMPSSSMGASQIHAYTGSQSLPGL